MAATPTTGYDLKLVTDWPAYKVPLAIPMDGTQVHNTSWTVDLWVYLRSNSVNSGLVSWSAGGSAWNDPGVNFYIRSQAGAGYAFNNGSSYLRAGTPPVGEWFHVAWVYDLPTTTGSVYENGTLVTSGPISNASQSGCPGFIHSGLGGVTPTIDGSIARLRQWSKALSAAEVAGSRDKEFLGMQEGLLSEHRLDSGSQYEWPSEFAEAAELLGYTHSTAVLSGRAIVNDPSSAPVDYVRLVSTKAKGVTRDVVPDANGNWAATVPSGEYMITYFASGFSPETHGPYIAGAV